MFATLLAVSAILAPAPVIPGPRPVVLKPQVVAFPDTITVTISNLSAPMAGFTNGMTLQMTRRPGTNSWVPVNTGPIYVCGQISRGFLNPADPVGTAVTKFSFTVRKITPLGNFDAPGVIDSPDGIPNSQRMQFMFSVPNALPPAGVGLPPPNAGVTFDARLN